MSSQTQTFACRKSWTVPAAHGVERLPVKPWRSRIRSRTGAFQPAVGLERHWCSTSRTWVASTTPVTSTSTQSSARRIGPAVSSGLAMRTRRLGAGDRGADAPRQVRAVAGAEPRADRHAADAVGAHRIRARAVDAAAPPQVVEVRAVGGGDAGVLRRAGCTFSWRSHESSVQFVEPVSTGRAVAHDELVVHEVRLAGDRAGRQRERLDQGRLGLRRRRVLGVAGAVVVVGQAHVDAAPRGADERVPDAVADLAGQADVVQREDERLAGGVEEAGDQLGDLRRVLGAVLERRELDALVHRSVLAGRAGAGRACGRPAGASASSRRCPRGARPRWSACAAGGRRARARGARAAARAPARGCGAASARPATSR